MRNRNPGRARGLAVALGTALLAAACARGAPAPAAEGTARSAIVLIGDGMGPQALGLLLSYRERARTARAGYAALSDAGTLGLMTTHSVDTVVIDSAAAATAMATGRRTSNGSVGVDPAGRPMRTILELAKAKGMATGLVSTTRITDATPAAFAAHVPSRKMEAEIAVQYLRDAAPEAVLGGGLRYWIPAGARAGEIAPLAPEAGAREPSKREDALNLVEEARGRGYAFVSDARSLEKAALDPATERLLGLFAASEIPYAVDRRGASTPIPSLAEMTRAALARLERAPGGFLLVVEGARIDHAGHQNDAGAMLGELVEFDAAVEAALAFARRRGDTAVVVVADHDTGGFGFTYRLRTIEGTPGETRPQGYDFAPFEDLDALGRQGASFERMLREARGDPVRLQARVRAETGHDLSLADAEAIVGDLRPPEGPERAVLVGAKDRAQAESALLARALVEQTNIVWSSAAHTSAPIVVAAWGPGTERFGGVYPNTEIAPRLAAALALP